MKRPDVRLPKTADSREYWFLFEDETDRAAAVSAGSYLEAVLERVLRSWMPPRAPADLINGFFDASRGFVGTFGAKKNLAYTLGILQELDRQDIQCIANVRNFFAHHVLDADTFQHQYVADTLRRISFYPYPKWFLKGSAPKRVKRTVAWLKQASLREFYLWAVDQLATGILAHLLPPATPRGFAVSMQLAGLCRVHEPLGHQAWALSSCTTAHEMLDDFWHKSEVFAPPTPVPKKKGRHRAAAAPSRKPTSRPAHGAARRSSPAPRASLRRTEASR